MSVCQTCHGLMLSPEPYVHDDQTGKHHLRCFREVAAMTARAERRGWLAGREAARVVAVNCEQNLRGHAQGKELSGNERWSALNCASEAFIIAGLIAALPPPTGTETESEVGR